MAISLGQTGTADSVDAEYFNWESADRRFMVHMHLDAIDGLARDAIENSQGLPIETGGILLGQVGRGERPVVWIERFQRIQIEHRAGPKFVLAADEYAAFERAARQFAEDGELIVVGFYRTHLRSGLQLEPPDFELASRYFRDAEDLVLLLKPVQKSGISAQFFGRDLAADAALVPPKPLGPPFPFRGRVVGVLESKPQDDDADERTAKTVVTPMPAPSPISARRLVPDFQPAVEPQKPREFSVTRSEPELDAPGFLHKRWPLLAALLLVGAVGGVIWQQSVSHNSTPPAQTNAPVRPLGLYVDPSGSNWRVSWNQSATALQNARDVKLFVREGEDQERVVPAQDLQSGVFEYQAKGSDVTFRLEATDRSGRVTAESFRVMTPKQAGPIAAPPVAPAAVAASPRAAQITPPKATRRVAPVVPASIRPRIVGSTPVDVRVTVDVRGRVTSATPVTKARNSIERYLVGRALYAARQWRFEPAREGGRPVAGTEIIHFVFDK